MSTRASDYRQAGRQFAQDKRRRAAGQAITDAEEAYVAARTACEEAPYPSTQYDEALAARKAAGDALYDLDPGNWVFS